MKSIFYVMLLSCCFLVSGSDFVLLKNGKPQAALVAGKQLKEEADFFLAEFKKCSGVELPFRNAGKNGENIIELILKPSDYISRSKYSISFPSKNIMRIEGTELSVRFALNFLLETAGVRYPMPGKYGGYYPVLRDFSLPIKNISRDAGFRLFRNLYAEDPEWQLALNNIPQNSYELVNHGIANLFPLSKYGREEWKDTLWAEIGGVRKKPVAGLWEPCYSSEITLREAVKNICERLDKNPNLHTIAMLHNDGSGECCTCAKCRVVDAKGIAVKTQFQKYPVSFRKNHSESYYRWVNRVAEEVLKKHPDTYFGVGAYNEMLLPPSFQLNSRVVVTICMESFAQVDSRVREFWETMIRKWTEKASHIGIWEYGYGLSAFTLPRAYYNEQDYLFKHLAANNGASVFVEGSPTFGEGPKRYLYLRQSYDPNLDFEAEVKDWCRVAVGREAAPFLLDYYQFWNRFWRERTVKTSWFQQSKFSHYTALIPDGEYIYCLEKGDMAKCRAWMEKVAELAGKYGDANQKIRASLLMTEFEFYEASAYMNGAEIIGINGIKDKNTALELIEKIPEMAKYSLKRKTIADKILKEFPSVWGGVYPSIRKSYANRFCNVNFPEIFTSLIPYLKDEDIYAKLQNVLSNPDIPVTWRDSMQRFGDIVCGRGKNLIPDGSFEHGGKGKWSVTGNVVTERAFDGKSSLKFVMPRDGKNMIQLSRVPMAAGKNHFLSFRVYLDADYPPGRAKAYAYFVGRNKIGYSTNYYMPFKVELISGKWNMVTTTANPGKTCAGSGDIMLCIEGMEKGAHVYVDDVVFVEMDMTQP